MEPRYPQKGKAMAINTLGIMQPYFFPYLGYFDLINCSDRWIVFDTVQYIRHGWVNRNRIHHPQNGDLYILVPLKKQPRETVIKDVIIADDQDWRSKILGQFNHYRKTAPYFAQTAAFLEDCLSIREPSLSRLNGMILEKTCARLGIPFQFQYYSEVNLQIGEVAGPGDWALRIAQALEAREYVNPPGGVDLFDPEKFKAANIQLTIRSIPAFEYPTRGYPYIPDLSILAVMAFNTPEQIKAFLDRQRSSRN
jgi:hypothetical protein